jgi:hypothetical protein
VDENFVEDAAETSPWFPVRGSRGDIDDLMSSLLKTGSKFGENAPSGRPGLESILVKEKKPHR